MAGDLSTPEPLNNPPWPEWKGNAATRCAAYKKTGERCRRQARRGTNVCDWHGAKAPQVKAKARQRLEEAADRMARELLKMATDENVSDATKLAAIRDALDRGGLGAKAAVEGSAQPLKPYEEVFDGIAQISRAESRARRGFSADRIATGPDGDVIDAELVAEPERSIELRVRRLVRTREADVAAAERDGADEDSTSTLGDVAPVQPCRSVSYDEAAELMATQRQSDQTRVHPRFIGRTRRAR